MTREEAILILGEFKEFCDSILWNSIYAERSHAIDMAIEALQAEYEDYEHATLVDIKEPLKVAVVRCKDCRQKHIGGNVTHYYWCDLWDREVNETDYCAWGERREP